MEADGIVTRNDFNEGRVMRRLRAPSRNKVSSPLSRAMILLKHLFLDGPLSPESHACVGWTARDEETTRIDLHRFAVLIERRRAHSDQAPVGTRFRRAHVKHFALCVQFIAWPHRPWPAQLVETDT